MLLTPHDCLRMRDRQRLGGAAGTPTVPLGTPHAQPRTRRRMDLEWERYGSALLRTPRVYLERVSGAARTESA